MAYFRIKNITSNLQKRDPNKDTTLDVEYNEGFKKKNQKLKPGAELYISSPNLPVEFHLLRMKRLITVNEISKNNFLKLQKPIPKVVTTNTTTEKEKPVSKKRIYKKKEELTETPNEI